MCFVPNALCSLSMQYSLCINRVADYELQVVFVRLKESVFSAQCSMPLKKVAEGLALYSSIK